MKQLAEKIIIVLCNFAGFHQHLGAHSALVGTVCTPSVCLPGSSPANRDADLQSSSRKTSWKALGTNSAKYAHECSREMHVQNVVHRNLLIKPKNFKNEQIV